MNQRTFKISHVSQCGRTLVDGGTAYTVGVRIDGTYMVIRARRVETGLVPLSPYIDEWVDDEMLAWPDAEQSGRHVLTLAEGYL